MKKNRIKKKLNCILLIEKVLMLNSHSEATRDFQFTIDICLVIVHHICTWRRIDVHTLSTWAYATSEREKKKEICCPYDYTEDVRFVLFLLRPTELLRATVISSHSKLSSVGMHGDWLIIIIQFIVGSQSMFLVFQRLCLYCSM